eukprot:CAMPEP_0113644024 /NCGR_PEP_ID=MMETSP0017_2-20120614/23162_1 /TAXON_ID=2856 /ORGANISM="Cylindrotheca closterium" /LENGTH=616 /DNA_ID=CAMNT_0000555597 /DNA_START=1 /DNA_END=1848 /DNA_ORIENTATION=+ /assembly_acc=CAM_ASM_000147
MSTLPQHYPTGTGTGTCTTGTTHCQCINITGLGTHTGSPPVTASTATTTTTTSHHHQQQQRQRQRQATNKTEVDDIIIQGMNSLSFVELQKEQEDLHGVPADLIERQEDITRTLKDLETHLQAILQRTQRTAQSNNNNNNNNNSTTTRTTAYETALKMNADYVQDKQFRMAFLRANRYDPKAAADQMIRHFQAKLDLFGKEPLARHIRLDDLDQHDMEYLLKGSYHISALKDRANRTILVEIPSRRKFQCIENELRCYFYIYMDVIRASYNNSPNNAGSSSIVYVNYGIGKCQGTHSDGVLKVFNLAMAMPFHAAGIHLCFNNKAEVMLCKAAIALMPPRMKAKVKVHSGSHLECRYTLSNYGIPYHALPLSITENEVIMDYQMAWFQDRIREENHMYNNNYNNKGEGDCGQGQGQIAGLPTPTNKIAPTESDVLCVGWKVNMPGNDRIRQMVSKHADWYTTGNPKERRILVDLIMKDIRAHGGRFLKLNEGSKSDYQELSVDEARIKIGQMFRNRKTRVRKLAAAQMSSQQQQQQQQQQSIVTSTQDQDVLFGRMYEHPGNQRLRLAVENMAEEYNASTRGRKKEIADSLVRGVKSRGGRFLKPVLEAGKWVEVS